MQILMLKVRKIYQQCMRLSWDLLEKIPRMLYFKIVLERKQVIVDHSRVWIRIFLRNMQIHLILKVQNLKSFRRQKKQNYIENEHTCDLEEQLVKHCLGLVAWQVVQRWLE